MNHLYQSKTKRHLQRKKNPAFAWSRLELVEQIAHVMYHCPFQPYCLHLTTVIIFLVPHLTQPPSQKKKKTPTYKNNHHNCFFPSNLEILAATLDLNNIKDQNYHAPFSTLMQRPCHDFQRFVSPWFEQFHINIAHTCSFPSI